MPDGFIDDDSSPATRRAIVAAHQVYYGREWGFGQAFAAKVASELDEFANRMVIGRDLILTAWNDGAFLGSIILDVTGGGEGGAHLRWFVVSDDARGTGVGTELMRRAMIHCDHHTGGRAWLTTFAGLEPARRLYEKHGFRLERESERDQWQGGVREQLFIRD